MSIESPFADYAMALRGLADTLEDPKATIEHIARRVHDLGLPLTLGIGPVALPIFVPMERAEGMRNAALDRAAAVCLDLRKRCSTEEAVQACERCSDAVLTLRSPPPKGPPK